MKGICQKYFSKTCSQSSRDCIDVVISSKGSTGGTRAALEDGLSSVDWDPVYNMDDADAIVDFITTRINEVLDLLCPVGAIRVRKGKCLYLSKETRALMKDRDKASGDNYKVLRNLVCSLVKRDHIMSHLSKLWEHPEDQRLIWQLANNSLGMGGPPSLPQSIIAPSGLKTSGHTGPKVKISSG
jgi:hypothetical protein